MAADRPAKCPKCGSARVALLLYAREDAAGISREELQTRRAVPAGRAPTGNDPRWRCLRCCTEWGHPRGLSGAAAGAGNLA